MTGLLSIAPVTTTVAGVTVHGVSAKGIALLLDGFPALRALMSGREVAVDELIQAAPDAVAAIIAAGIGYPGDAQQIEAAAALPLDLQADFIAAILKLTMPKGPKGFLEKLSGLGLSIPADAQPIVASAATAPVMKSRKASKP